MRKLAVSLKEALRPEWRSSSSLSTPKTLLKAVTAHPDLSQTSDGRDAIWLKLPEKLTKCLPSAPTRLEQQHLTQLTPTAEAAAALAEELRSKGFHLFSYVSGHGGYAVVFHPTSSKAFIELSNELEAIGVEYRAFRIARLR